MRAATIAIVLVTLISSMLAQRPAIATQPAPGSPSPDSQPAPTIDPGPLRCECAPVSDSEWHWTKRRKVGLAVVGFGVVSGAVGLGFAWSAHRIYEEGSQLGMPFRPALEQQLRDRNLVAGTLIGVAGLSALAGAALVLWPETKHVSVIVLPSGGALVACGGTL